MDKCLFFYLVHRILCKEYKIINKLKVNIDQIKQKIDFIKLKTRAKICVSVKADAYGTGMVHMAKAIQKNVDYFAVANVYEFSVLRRQGIFKPVLILSPVLYEELELAIKLGGEISIDSVFRLHQVQMTAIKLNKIAKVHIQIDSGMRRFGVTSLREYFDILDAIKDGTNVTLVGVYSHFYSQDYKIQAMQREIFERIILETHRKQFYPMFHLSASSGVMEKKNVFDMVRLGICLYEQYCELESQIIAIKKLKKGEGLGYDHEYIANEDTLIGVVGIGYGDGMFRCYSGKGYVEIFGARYKMVGNICMDCLFVDLGETTKIKIGDSVKLFGNSAINICEVAKSCDTITYEVLTRITRRVKREYLYASNNWSIPR